MQGLCTAAQALGRWGQPLRPGSHSSRTRVGSLSGHSCVPLAETAPRFLEALERQPPGCAEVFLRGAWGDMGSAVIQSLELEQQEQEGNQLSGDCHEDYAVICNSSHLAGCRAEVSKQGTSDQCLAAGNCQPLNGRMQAALTSCPQISSACLWSSVSVIVLTAGLQPSVLLECLGSALPFANHSNGRPGGLCCWQLRISRSLFGKVQPSPAFCPGRFRFPRCNTLRRRTP